MSYQELPNQTEIFIRDNYEYHVTPTITKELGNKTNRLYLIEKISTYTHITKDSKLMWGESHVGAFQRYMAQNRQGVK